MPDISLRFQKDMLVLSSPLRAALERQGIDVERDTEFSLLFEADSVQDAMRLESIAGAQCLVAPTANLTPARLLHVGMEGKEEELAAAALAVVRSLKPQHVLYEIAPCGLPLDPSSKVSLNEMRSQYARAARVAAAQEIDAVFLNDFSSCDDLLCALMGVRQVYDGVVFASVVVDGEGAMARGSKTLEDAVAIMAEYGADVYGFSTKAAAECVRALAKRMVAVAQGAPVLAQIDVAKVDPKQRMSKADNPYYCLDMVVDLAVALRADGVQFLRATGNATPAYTGALFAMTTGLDVVLPDEEPEQAQAVDVSSKIEALKSQIADFLPKEG